jgi:hypothetical protein
VKEKTGERPATILTSIGDEGDPRTSTAGRLLDVLTAGNAFPLPKEKTGERRIGRRKEEQATANGDASAWTATTPR